MSKAVLILANPTAKRGQAAVRRAVDKLAAGFSDKGCQVISRFTERDGPRERQLVSEHADSVQTIVAVGGDGTVRETVLGMNDVQRARIAIGFVPMGNANVLAREVGIAWNNQDLAIKQVLESNPKPLDVGAINGKPTFLLMMDVGYFAEVVHTVTKLRSRRLTNWMYSIGGDVLYGIVGLLKFLTLKRASLTVEADGHTPFSARSLAICNASVYAKTGSFCPNASPSDGMLDFNAARPGKTISYSFAAMAGKPKESLSHLGAARRYTLRANRQGFVCQVDGDPLANGPFTELQVEVLPAYFSLIMPTKVR